MITQKKPLGTLISTVSFTQILSKRLLLKRFVWVIYTLSYALDNAVLGCYLQSLHVRLLLLKT